MLYQSRPQGFELYMKHLPMLVRASFINTAPVAAGCGDNAVRLFEGNLQNGESDSVDGHEAASFQLAFTKQQAHNADVNCVRWSPRDSTLLATAGDDHTIKLWRYKPDPDRPVQ